MPSLVYVFDFDRTVLDNDGDSAVAKHLGVYEQLRTLYHDEKMQWTKIMDKIFSPFTQREIEGAIEATFAVSAGMKALMGQIGKMQSGAAPLPAGVTAVHLALCTDANSFFVEHAFRHFFPGTRIDSLYTNPAQFVHRSGDASGGEPTMCIAWCEPHGHGCARCNESGLVNMCKGKFVDAILRAPPHPDPVLFFFGDGFNDLCAITHLRACDTGFVRRGFSLEKELRKGAGEEMAKTASAPAKKQDGGGGDADDGIDPASGGAVASPMLHDKSSLPPPPPPHGAPDRLHFPLASVCDPQWKGVCRLSFWSTGDDLFPRVNAHIAASLADVPRLHLFGDGPQPARDHTFRGYSQAVRVPLCLRQAMQALQKQQQTQAADEAAAATLAARVAAVAALADAVEHDKAVDAACLRIWSPSVSAAAMKAPLKWGDMPWLHGEVLLHRRLDRIIRGKAVTAAAAGGATDFSDDVDEKPLSIETDWWQPSKVEATVHAIPWLESIIVESERLWSAADSSSSSAAAAAAATTPEEISLLVLHQLQGNVADLCFRTSSDVKNMFTPTLVADDRAQLAEYILDIVRRSVNDTDGSKTKLNSAGHELFLVDVVTDNAGPELAADLLFVGCLLALAGRGRRARLVVKDRPFYVSDVCPHDVGVAVAHFAASANATVRRFAAVLRGMLDERRIHVVPLPWTTRPVEFRELAFESSFFGWRVPASNAGEKREGADDDDDHFFSFVPRTELVVTKGDLNFRRLVSDREHPIETPFRRVLADTPFRGLPAVAAVRTLKCEVLCGVAQATRRRLLEEDGASEHPVTGWRVDGKRGLVLFEKR